MDRDTETLSARPEPADITIGMVADAYQRCGESMSNQELYKQLGLDTTAKSPVGKAQARHSLAARKVRWHQQTLKRLNVICPEEGKRGHWRASIDTMGDERDAAPNVAMVAFSTKLGVALWACWESVSLHWVKASRFPLAHHRKHCAFPELMEIRNSKTTSTSW